MIEFVDLIWVVGIVLSIVLGLALSDGGSGNGTGTT